MADDIVKIDERSRIVYVDPNDVFGYGGENGKKQVPMTPPYEDMCIAFNLIVEQYDRFDPNKTKEFSLNWVSESTRFSVLQGELKTQNGNPTDDDNYDNSYLTTYYTEISNDGYKKKEMVEGLGVTSIQVSFDSYFAPTVTIQFVDVRGSALFGREEAIHSSHNGDSKINANNIFGVFFQQPYPRFRLQMKGFYGKDVTYQLTLSSPCKAKFNAKTGNVEFTANFIAYSWALLADIPLAYLIAAPYCNFAGEAYWNSHVGSKEWELMNNPAVGATSTRPPRLHDLFQIIRSCVKEAQSKTDNVDNENAAIIQKQREELDKISGLVKNYDNAVSDFKKATDEKKGDFIKDVQHKYNELYDELEQNGQDVDLPKLTSRTCYEEHNNEGVISYTITYDTSDIRTNISSLITSYNKRTEEEIRKAKIEFVKESLRQIQIDPNIYNIFKILMCHLETFCYILFEANRQIQHQGTVGERTFSHLGIDVENTDIPNSYSKINVIPAWPAIFNNRSQTTVNENEIDYSSALQWVGDLQKSDNWIEQRVVWSLQNAIQHIIFDPKDNSAPSPIQRDPNTIFNLPSDINLYGDKSKIFKQLLYNKSGFDNLCGALGIRASQLFGIMDNTMHQNINMVKLMGEIDAYNFYLSISNIDDIKSGLLEHIKGELSDVVLDCLTCNNSDNDKNYSYNNGFHIFEYENMKNNRHPMYEKTDRGYKYVYFLDEENIPLVPSILDRFDDKQYYNYIKLQDPSLNGGKLVYKGIVSNNKSNKWLSVNTNRQVKDCINEDMFNIIDDKKSIDDILQRYNNIKSGKFTLKGYNVDNQKSFGDFVNRYWHLDYHRMTSNNTLPYNFIGKSVYKSKGIENVKEYANVITNSNTVWDALHDSMFSSYEITDFNKLKDGDGNSVSVDSNLFIKSITVKDNDNNNICSLFAHPLYYMQSTKGDNREIGLKSRAFLFLQSLPRGCNFNNSFFTSHSNLTIYNRLNILYLGGLLWRKSCAKEPIVYSQDKLSYQIFANKLNGLYVSDSGSGILEADTTISTLLNTLNIDNNIKTQLIEYFNDFVKNEFYKIDNWCQLYNGTNRFESGIAFKQWVDKIVKDKDGKYNNDTYFCGYYNNVGLDLIFDEGNYKLQKLIKSIVFDQVIIMNNGIVGKSQSNSDIVIPSNVFSTYLNTFKSTLEKIYTSNSSVTQEYNTTGLTDNIDEDKNVLLSIYTYCKNIWDNWLSPMSGASVSSNPNNIKSDNKIELYEQHYNVGNFFKKFKFIDAYYNDISTKMKLNLDVLYQSYTGRSKEGSLLTFIGDIVSKHHCLFVPLPDFVDLGLTHNRNDGIAKMIDMFKPMPYNAMGAPQLENNFVVMYTYPPASKLPYEFTYRDDGFDIYSTEVVPDWFKSANRDELDGNEEPTKYGYNVPSFCVAFAKQNNHLFKEFNLSMENPVETEYSIKTLVNTAEIAKGGGRQVAFRGQDIYNIFTNYSYIVEIEMMGDAQIQPLMYFQLMNIPMWRGAYMIFNVTHNMTPGNMSTRFKAMKLSKNPVPFVSKWWSFIPDAYMNGYDNILGGVDNSSNINIGYVEKFTESGRHSKIEDNGATPHNFIEGSERNKHCDIAKNRMYFNCGYNNYFSDASLSSLLNQTVFTLNDGSKYDLKKVINFIYNHAHFSEYTKTKDGKTIAEKCKPKNSTLSIGACAEYVFNAVGNGFDVFKRLDTGNAQMKDINKNVLNKYFKFISPNEMPEYACPGDIVLFDYKQVGGIDSGHATMFTGKHWVSDFIQSDGLYSINKAYKSKALKCIYAIYRIPGIENYIKSTYTFEKNNKNPGNVSQVTPNWEGSYNTANRFPSFKSWEYGFRCLFINLNNAYLKNGLNTIKTIINKWAPESENKTGTYIKNMVNWMNKDLKLNLTSDTPIFKENISNCDVSYLISFARSMCKQEHSIEIEEDVIRKGLSMALNSDSVKKH